MRDLVDNTEMYGADITPSSHGIRPVVADPLVVEPPLSAAHYLRAEKATHAATTRTRYGNKLARKRCYHDTKGIRNVLLNS